MSKIDAMLTSNETLVRRALVQASIDVPTLIDVNADAITLAAAKQAAIKSADGDKCTFSLSLAVKIDLDYGTVESKIAWTVKEQRTQSADLVERPPELFDATNEA